MQDLTDDTEPGDTTRNSGAGQRNEILLQGRGTELRRYHLHRLVTENTMVHDKVLIALCEECMQLDLGRVVMLDTDYTQLLQKTTGLRGQNWLIKMGRERAALLQENSRILLPMVKGGHFSLLDIDMANNTVQHHDSLTIHSGNRTWARIAQKLGQKIRDHIKRRDGYSNDEHDASRRRRRELRQRIVIRNPYRQLRTQTRHTNTCMMHTYHFIRTIIQRGKPTPITDERAIAMRQELARELWQHMRFVGSQTAGATYPGKI